MADKANQEPYWPIRRWSIRLCALVRTAGKEFSRKASGAVGSAKWSERRTKRLADWPPEKKLHALGSRAGEKLGRQDSGALADKADEDPDWPIRLWSMRLHAVARKEDKKLG